MRHRLTPIQKERDAIACQSSTQNVLVAVEAADEHGALAESAACLDELEDLPVGAGLLAAEIVAIVANAKEGAATLAKMVTPDQRTADD